MEQSDWFSERSNPAVRTGLPNRFVSKLKTKCFRHYNKHLIGWACSLRIGGYWSSTFLCFHGPCLRLGPYKHKKVLDQYPPIRTSCSVNNLYVGTSHSVNKKYIFTLHIHKINYIIIIISKIYNTCSNGINSCSMSV
jgi:hypothetical protein